MIRKLAREESGYSLVEVIVSIFILAAAILPMVGMFDMGLKLATQGGNYDKARTLANANLESVRALAWTDAKLTYTPTNATTPGSPVSCNHPPPSSVFTCTVTTKYLDDDFADAASANTPTTRMSVAVTVQWGASNSYTTTGLKAR